MAARGGRREGAGRKVGEVTKKTLEIRALAREYAPKAFQGLIHLAEHAETESVRVTAIKEILDRGYGKAPQAITGEDGEGAPTFIVETHIIDHRTPDKT